MRKKLLALLMAAAMALSLLAGCGGGESAAQVLLNLLDGKYPNISIEIDPDLEADLRQAISTAEAESENETDDAAVIRAALETALGSTITFRYLGDGQKGDTAFDLVFYAGADPDKAAQAAYSQWNLVFSNVPGDGQYDTSLAMVETNSGVWMLVKATVEKAGTVDKPDSEPVKTSIDAADYDNWDDLKTALQSNPSITEVNFSDITDEIPEGVLSGTNVSKVIVSTTTNVGNAFSGVSGLTIEVTGSGTVNSSILGGASGVTLDLSRSGITSIGWAAFKGCTGLTSVTFPESLTAIRLMAFQNCSDLTSIDLSGCTSLNTIDDDAFNSCDSLTSVDLSGCNGLTTIGRMAFQKCSDLTSIDLSNCSKLTTIDLRAFIDCTALTSIDLSGCTSLNTIDENAFTNCTALTSVDLNGCTGLTDIMASAFSGCDSLTSIDLNDCIGLEYIGYEAFYGCDSLSQVTLPSHDRNLSISYRVFNNSSSLDILIPDANIELSLEFDTFWNREVTVYCNCDKEQEKIILENLTEAGAKGTGPTGAIVVYPYDAFLNN